MKRMVIPRKTSSDSKRSAGLIEDEAGMSASADCTCAWLSDIVPSIMITESTIEYDEARLALDAIHSELLKRGKAAVIAVCDAHGDLIAFARMDGAPLSSITIAMNKAYSAARERKPTNEIGDAARNPGNGFDIGYFGDPRFTGWGGGIPIWKKQPCGWCAGSKLLAAG
jgi:glc operon protein GlcG